jgi:hypothetical protein
MHIKYTEKEIKNITDKYIGGLEIKEIAAIVGLKKWTIRYILKSNGVKLRQNPKIEMGEDLKIKREVTKKRNKNMELVANQAKSKLDNLLQNLKVGSIVSVNKAIRSGWVVVDKIAIKAEIIEICKHFIRVQYENGMKESFTKNEILASENIEIIGEVEAC